MLRRIEPDGRVVWYLEPRAVYILLACIIVISVLKDTLLPCTKAKTCAQTGTVYKSVYEARIISIIRQSDSNNTSVSSDFNMKSCWTSEENINKVKGNISKLITQAETLNDLLKHHTDMEGGTWKPRDCIARHRVAIIIPYRERKQHLINLLSTLLPLLKAQALHFGIYLSEQDGQLTFNKGVLMNAAFLEALKDQHWDCFVFHDVDLLPENIRIQYSCPERPRHLSASIDEFDYVLPYESLVGGVLVLRTEDYLTVNGYSNLFWGWGGEDDDMTVRLQTSRLRVERPPYNVARYHQIKHIKRKPAQAKIRIRNLVYANQRIDSDGVNSVDYSVVSRTDRHLFTHLLIDVGMPPDS